MAAITELDYSNGNNDDTDATDTDISAGGNFGDFIEVTLTSTENIGDFALVLFHNDGSVAGLLDFSAMGPLNSYAGPGGQQIFVFGSDEAPNTAAGGTYVGQDTLGWNKVDLSQFTPSGAYAAGTNYAAGTYSANNPAGGLGSAYGPPGPFQGNVIHFINASGSTADSFAEPRTVMLFNDATGTVVDFYSMGKGSGFTVTAAPGTPGAGATSTNIPNAGGNSFNFGHGPSGPTGSGPTALVQNPGEIICFASGTRILTSEGYRPVETLRVGDMIETLDDGLCELRWLGGCRVRGTGKFAPVYVPAGVLNNDQPLLVSQQHRFAVKGHWVELATGSSDCLVAAKHMVGFHGIRLVSQRSVTYWHLLLDGHQLIWADGALAESFYVGPQALNSVEKEAYAEITTLFPDLLADVENGYGQMVRKTADRGEAILIMENMLDVQAEDRATAE